MLEIYKGIKMNIRAVVLNDELGAIAYVLKRMGYDVAAIYVKENK